MHETRLDFSTISNPDQVCDKWDNRARFWFHNLDDLIFWLFLGQWANLDIYISTVYLIIGYYIIKSISNNLPLIEKTICQRWIWFMTASGGKLTKPEPDSQIQKWLVSPLAAYQKLIFTIIANVTEVKKPKIV